MHGQEHNLHKYMEDDVLVRDAHGYPDNKLSGNIRIINYPFNYPSTWRLILFMYFLGSFSRFLRYFTKILYINTSTGLSKSGWTERTTIGLYFRDFTLSVPPGPIMNLWFWLLCPFSEIIYRKRHHIGIRIFIRIIYYLINGYPDSKLSVLSIPSSSLT